MKRTLYFSGLLVLHKQVYTLQRTRKYTRIVVLEHSRRLKQPFKINNIENEDNLIKGRDLGGREDFEVHFEI